MLSGNHQQAIEIYNSVYYKIMTTRKSENDFVQAANSRSNNALNMWVVGADPISLKEIWSDEYLQGEHVESKFYPILINFLDGNTTEALKVLKKLPSVQIKELIETFTEHKDESSWFGEISRKSLDLLENF